MKFFISYKNYPFHILLLHIIISCDLSGQTNKKFDATFKIWTEKDHHLSYEPIWIDYRVENRGEIGPSIGSATGPGILRITDSKGVKYRPVIDAFGIIQPMKPGQIYQDEVYISNSYSHPDSIMECKIFGYDFVPGHYRIQGFHGRRECNALYSNIIVVTVAEPEGDEKEAMKLFKEGIGLKHENKDKKRELREKIFWELVQKYPNSVYTVNTLWYIHLNHTYLRDIKNLEKMVVPMKKIIEEYPNSRKTYRHKAMTGIKEFYRRKGDIHGAKEYMLKLQKIVKDREIKDRIEKTIQEIDQGKFIIE